MERESSAPLPTAHLSQPGSLSAGNCRRSRKSRQAEQATVGPGQPLKSFQTNRVFRLCR